jgi:hypothetical protein
MVTGLSSAREGKGMTERERITVNKKSRFRIIMALKGCQKKIPMRVPKTVMGVCSSMLSAAF